MLACQGCNCILIAWKANPKIAGFITVALLGFISFFQWLYVHTLTSDWSWTIPNLWSIMYTGRKTLQDLKWGHKEYGKSCSWNISPHNFFNPFLMENWTPHSGLEVQYTVGHVSSYRQILSQTSWVFSTCSHRNSKMNDTSFESRYKTLLESGKKMVKSSIYSMTKLIWMKKYHF